MNWFKRFCCWIGWHKWGCYEFIEQAGINMKARCPWCHYEGMIDSQGNLF